MEWELEGLPEQKSNKPKPKNFMEQLEAREKGELESQEETALESGIKTVARLPFRVAETVGGYVADAYNFPQKVINAGLNYGGKALTGIPLGVSPEEQQILDRGQQRLPYSSELKEKTHKLLPWTKSDKGSWSEKLERATEILTAFALPATVGKVLQGASAASSLAPAISGPVGSAASRIPQALGHVGKTFAQEAGKDLAKVVGSETAGWMAKQLGASEETESYVRMGTLFLTQLWGGREKVKQAASEGYNKSAKMAEGAERVNATGFAEDVDKILHKVVNEGTSTRAKDWLKPHIERLKQKIANGSMAVNDAVQWVQDLRGHLRDGNVPFRAQPQVHELIGLIKKNVVDPYGKVNKEFGKVFGDAEQAWSALYKDNKFTSFIQQHFSEKPWASKIASALTHAGIAGGAHYAGKAIPALGATLTAHQSYRFYKLIKDSALARDVYGKLIKASLAGNVSAASKMMQQFDKIAKNYEDKHPEDDEEGEWELEEA